MHTDRILRENELKANRMMTMILNVTIVIVPCSALSTEVTTEDIKGQ